MSVKKKKKNWKERLASRMNNIPKKDIKALVPKSIPNTFNENEY